MKSGHICILYNKQFSMSRSMTSKMKWIYIFVQTSNKIFWLFLYITLRVYGCCLNISYSCILLQWFFFLSLWPLFLSHTQFTLLKNSSTKCVLFFISCTVLSWFLRKKGVSQHDMCLMTEYFTESFGYTSVSMVTFVWNLWSSDVDCLLLWLREALSASWQIYEFDKLYKTIMGFAGKAASFSHGLNYVYDTKECKGIQSDHIYTKTWANQLHFALRTTMQR